MGGVAGKVTMFDREQSAAVQALLEDLEHHKALVILLRSLLDETLNAWASFETAAHDDGGCMGYGSCREDPCTEISPRIDEIRRESGLT
jgi:hypothetical protein